jgi:hypothetical protein
MRLTKLLLRLAYSAKERRSQTPTSSIPVVVALASFLFEITDIFCF